VRLALPRVAGDGGSLLGIVKSGAAYLPLDQSIRGASAVHAGDAQPALLLTTSELGERLPETGCVRWRMDEKQTRAALSAQPQSNLSKSSAVSRCCPSTPPIVIYTSGPPVPPRES